MRRWWLMRVHVRFSPEHVLVGRDGQVWACGTCRGVPDPNLIGLPWSHMTAKERRRAARDRLARIEKGNR